VRELAVGALEFMDGSSERVAAASARCLPYCCMPPIPFKCRAAGHRATTGEGGGAHGLLRLREVWYAHDHLARSLRSSSGSRAPNCIILAARRLLRRTRAVTARRGASRVADTPGARDGLDGRALALHREVCWMCGAPGSIGRVGPSAIQPLRGQDVVSQRTAFVGVRRNAEHAAETGPGVGVHPRTGMHFVA
jgi:hypothetical protein